MIRFKDLTGQRFGRLYVLRRGPNVSTGKSRPAQFFCLCDCGNTVLVRGGNLSRKVGKDTKSCGCYRREASSRRMIEKTDHPDKAIARAFISSYKHGAKSRGLEYTLTDEEALSMALENCVYCGVAPCRPTILYARKKTAQGQLLLNGLDRVDNTVGYTPSNCVPCCALCNQAKHTMTYDRWMEYISRLVNFHTCTKKAGSP